VHGVRKLPLYDERYLLLTAGDGPYGAADELGWREAADERLCLFTPDMQNRRIVDGAFAAAGACPRPVVETNSISTLYAHVRAGVVGAVVAHTWLHLYPVPAGMRAVPLARPDVRQSIGLVWPDHRAEPLLTRALITTVRDVDLVAVLDRGAAPSG
jgi:DNA-binding transcriptional LysR family regulator